MNLFKDFANAVRQEMSAQGYDVAHVKDDDHAAVVLYSKMHRYTIRPRLGRLQSQATKGKRRMGG